MNAGCLGEGIVVSLLDIRTRDRLVCISRVSLSPMHRQESLLFNFSLNWIVRGGVC
jgi:hypothetical protein